MRQNVAPIVFHAQTAHPAIKYLDRVGACAHLLGSVFAGYRHQLAHELIPGLRGGIHHFLSMDVVPGTPSLNHVARQGEWSAAEADHGQSIAKMLAYQRNRFRDIAEFGGLVRAQLCYVLLITDRLVDYRTFASFEVERESHHF